MLSDKCFKGKIHEIMRGFGLDIFFKTKQNWLLSSLEFISSNFSILSGKFSFSFAQPKTNFQRLRNLFWNNLLCFTLKKNFSFLFFFIMFSLFCFFFRKVRGFRTDRNSQSVGLKKVLKNWNKLTQSYICDGKVLIWSNSGHFKSANEEKRFSIRTHKNNNLSPASVPNASTNLKLFCQMKRLGLSVSNISI